MAAERATVEQRGLALLRRLERVAKAVWWSPSQSGGEGHVVAVVAGELHCDCPGFTWRSTCAHAQAAHEWIRRASEGGR